MSTDKGIELAHAAAMPAPQGGALPTGLEWQALERMADTLSRSSVIPYRLKGKPADVAVVLLAAREYGIPPLMALSKLPVVNGTPAPMGELMVALILRAGHYIAADFREPDGTIYAGGPVTPEHYGEARYKRRDWPEREVLRFTLAEAIQAGLVTLNPNGTPRARDDKDRPTPWEQYLPNMARWRAVANAARLNFADVLLGLSYLPEELGAIVDEEGAPIEAEFVGPRGGAPQGSLEQRTAQESADKLTEQPWPDHVLAAVRLAAEEGGYLTATVAYAGSSMTLEEAINRHAEERTGSDIVDAVVVEATPQEEADKLGEYAGTDVAAVERLEAEYESKRVMDEPVTFRGNSMTLGGAVTIVKIETRERLNPPARPPWEQGQDAQTAPVTDPGPPAAPEEPPAPAPGPQNAAQGETPEAAALDTANAALASDSRDVVAGFYSSSPDLRMIDVSAAITDEDLVTIGLNPDEVRGIPVPLGSLLIKVGQYVTKHGNAVRYMGRPTAEDEPFDPWAADAAAGWPDKHNGPE